MCRAEPVGSGPPSWMRGPRTCDVEFGPGDAMLCARISTRAMRALDLWSSRTGEGKGVAVERLVIEYLS